MDWAKMSYPQTWTLAEDIYKDLAVLRILAFS